MIYIIQYKLMRGHYFLLYFLLVELFKTYDYVFGFCFIIIINEVVSDNDIRSQVQLFISYFGQVLVIAHL